MAGGRLACQYVCLLGGDGWGRRRRPTVRANSDGWGMGLDGSGQLLAQEGQEDTRREEGPGGGGSRRVWLAEVTNGEGRRR